MEYRREKEEARGYCSMKRAEMAPTMMEEAV